MNRQITFLLALFILTSCSSRKSEIKLYGKCQTPMYACLQLLLKDDKTFEQYVFFDVGGEKIMKGTWEIVKGDTLKLNSFEQPVNDEFLDLSLASPYYLRDELIILKNNKVTFLPKPYHKRFYLKRNQPKNKKWQ